MQRRTEPLTRRERRELARYGSPWVTGARRVLFALVVGGVALVGWRIQQRLGFAYPVWPLPPALVAVWLYRRAAAWTGGPTWRALLIADLRGGMAQVCTLRVVEARVFDELEDEGHVVLVRTDADETYVFVGQHLARAVARGFPWSQFDIREAPQSRLLLGLRRRGGPCPAVTLCPPVSHALERQLQVAQVRGWARLDVPFLALQPHAPSDGGVVP